MDIPLKCDVDYILLAYGEAMIRVRLLESQIKELREELTKVTKDKGTE